jgi:hypothetical protein
MGVRRESATMNLLDVMLGRDVRPNLTVETVDLAADALELIVIPDSSAESRFAFSSRILALMAGLSMPTTAWCSWVSIPSALHSAGSR